MRIGGEKMRSRADEVRKNIARRKKMRDKEQNTLSSSLLITEEEERHGFGKLPTYEAGPDEGNHPLFRKEIFFMKLLTSAILVLVVGILFKNPASSLDPARTFVKDTMEKDFQFAVVSDWYEGKFGKPLALFPLPNESEKKAVNGDHFALPASGKILEEFEVSGQKVTIETGKGAEVEAINEGMIRFIGEKEGFGKTVIIQHSDNSETWYGNLNKISIGLYDYVEKGKKVGTVANSSTDNKGEFYFAIKKGDDFIDPIQVIQFE
jgi:stage IV sporulation protein FA